MEPFLKTKLIAFSFISTVVAITFVAASGVIKPSVGAPESLTQIFLFIGVVDFFLAFVIRKAVLQKGIKKDGPSQKPTVQIYFLATLISFALFEAIAIMGLVAFMQSGDIYYTYSMSALAALGMIANWPKDELI